MKNKIVIALVACFLSIGMYSQKKQAAKKTINKTTKAVNKVPATEKTAYVDPLKTYERIGDKGYQLSPEQLKKVGNSCYFNGELEKAAKFYSELYALKPQDLEPEFYYRYAQSLKSIKDYEKADQMMALFNQKKT